MVELQRQTLEGLAARHDALIGQFCEMLPGLVMEAARRVLATVEIDEKIVKNIVAELITEIHPGADGLEISLNERDLELIEGVESMYDQKYPGICFISNRDLHPGDCIVRSRFGTLDGSIATKLDNVEALLQ
jgi:flagellar assembly protein FliH